MIDTTAARIIDCDWSVAATANAVKSAGIDTVIRYYSVSSAHPTKILSKDELTALDNAGLSVAVVFENGSAPGLFDDPQKKIGDVSAALNCANNVNQPAGTPIYFAADFDIAPASEQAVYDYFEYAHDQLAAKGYKTGAYGCGRTADLVSGAVPGKAKVADFFWISASVAYAGTVGFYNSPNWHLFQNKTEIPSHLIPATYTDQDGVHPIPEKDRTIDTDVLNDRFQNFGQWRKDGSTPPYPSADSKLVLANRAFSIRNPAPVFATPNPGSATIDHVLYARNIRILERHPDGIVGVSLDESSVVRGYCQTSDLTGDLTTMPPWPAPGA